MAQRGGVRALLFLLRLHQVSFPRAKLVLRLKAATRNCAEAEVWCRSGRRSDGVRRNAEAPQLNQTDAGMQVWRALLLLGLSTLLHATSSPRRPAGRRVKLALDRFVWPESSGRTASSLANMSLSPWTYKVSSELSRLPRWIYNAQCLTSHCESLQGDGEDTSLEVKPIYYEMLVLQRVPIQRKAKKVKYEFQLRAEVVSVGCTCVRPTVIPQQ